EEKLPSSKSESTVVMPFGHLAAMSRGSLRDEVSCSICLQLFQDPVSIHCGHSFCRSRSLRPNWELAGVVEATKVSARRPAGMAGAGENLCQEHQEALKLFCEDEQRLICIICNTSRAHRKHSVVPVAEAAQEYRLQRLRQEREALRSSRKRQEDQAQDYARRGQAEKQKFMTQYKELHKFLERWRAITVARMEQLD
ncbi:PREDICTED: tripartite motif-containing protein 52-like, partial [Buceros rhinoceros silvestris]|uniref:tripartite motif-containing protein 52-like n=1 Tax=Buceros rhinoceros silvestris TaxID=175836 RepID=UPI0005289612